MSEGPPERDGHVATGGGAERYTNRVAQNPRREIPAAHRAIMERKIAPNGLAWRKFECQQCGRHLSDEGVLLGCLRKLCPNCKYPNVIEVNRVGEEEVMEYMAMRKAEERQAAHDKQDKQNSL